VIGSPMAGRNHPDIENTPGIFINTAAMRNYPVDSKSFGEFLMEIRETSLKAFENQDCQFESLVERLDIKRDLSRNPIFDVMFVMQNMQFERVSLNGLKTMELMVFADVSKVDLTLTGVEKEGNIDLYFEYCTKLFHKETIERLGVHFENILKQIVDNSKIKIADIEIITDDEKNIIFYEFNNALTEIPDEKTVNILFEEQVEKSPEKTALVFGDKKICYSDLNKSSNQLARKLKQNGVKADSIVGLMVSRSIEMIVGILAILKAGGAYLPIDPCYPAERIQYMLESSETDIVLIDKTVDVESLSLGSEKPIKFIDLSDRSIYMGEDSNLRHCGSVSDLAYILYTSGSTGRPKGVMVEHRGLCSLINGFTDRISISEENTILCLTTVSFDIFFVETLLPLAKGLTVVIANEQQQLDPAAMDYLIRNNSVDVLQTTPSRLQLILQSNKADRCLENIKILILGGEAIPEVLINRLNKLENTRIYNGYGPTEGSVYSSFKDMTGCRDVNIGKPVANTHFYILNKNDQLQPIGIPGEIHISGYGLARGYLNRPELTAEKFIANPYSGVLKPGFNCPLLYRTGDLARWLPDGDVEYLGRIDNQVKVRGYRIELSEIEKCMLEHQSIENCVCTVKDDDYGSKYIAAYYVSDEEIPVSDIRRHLTKSLPEYMVPQSFTYMEEIPMTPNGKINRRALPEPDMARPMLQNECIAALTDTEKTVAEVWGSILKRESIGVNDNFFDLGGNSLLLVFMHSS
ncbi:MAG TPA: amino acid adenylation domain-containing protein, partial [Clostridia bacterium]|nr:amino acid adenylation domain-containing protein [Clostridia bacterium]